MSYSSQKIMEIQHFSLFPSQKFGVFFATLMILNDKMLVLGKKGNGFLLVALNVWTLYKFAMRTWKRVIFGR